VDLSLRVAHERRHETERDCSTRTNDPPLDSADSGWRDADSLSERFLTQAPGQAQQAEALGIEFVLHAQRRARPAQRLHGPNSALGVEN
jgi:hypothetical protein